MRQRLAQLHIDTEVRLNAYRGLTKPMKGGTPGPRGLRGKWMWAEGHQRVTSWRMEIQGAFSRSPAERVGGGRRALAAHLPALAGQLDRGRHHRHPKNIIAERVLGLPKG